MEYAKGAQLDTEFALGFITELLRTVTVLHGVESGHWRPLAALSLPFGSVTADTGLAYSIGLGAEERLLIIEREASAPGNERNLLKWYEAMRGGHAIHMKFGSQQIPVHPQRITLLLCFARTNPTRWTESDFQKTVGYCRLLADLINKDLAGKSPSFKVYVEAKSHAVTNWHACGQDFAKTCRAWLLL